MALKELDLTNYYEIEGKVSTDQFLYLLNDMLKKSKEKGYHSYCVTDALEKIYGLNDCEIAFFIKNYGTKINYGPNGSEKDIKIFGLVMELEQLLLVCDEMHGHGYTPIDIVANFAIKNDVADEYEIIKEAIYLSNLGLNDKQARDKKYILKRYSKKYN